MKCYADILGDCSTKQSKEHYLSKGIWSNPNITFEGFSWLKGESKTLPVKNVARKILCKHHNEILSELDVIAKEFFNCLARMHKNQSKRSKLKRSAIWKTDRAEFDGKLLERLFAKIAVGVFQEDKEKLWHFTQSPQMKPPQIIIEAIFGRNQLEFPFGLYLVTTKGDNIYDEDRVTIHTLFHPETKNYVGSIIGFRHWQFLMNFTDENPNEYTFESITGKIIGKGGSNPLYHPQGINFNVGGKHSGLIKINW